MGKRHGSSVSAAYSNTPLSQTYSTTPTTLFRYVAQKAGVVNVQVSVTSERTEPGYSSLRLLINGAPITPPVQAGFESESTFFAPDILPMTFNWTGRVHCGTIITVVAVSSAGVCNVTTSSNFPTAVGAQFTVLCLP